VQIILDTAAEAKPSNPSCAVAERFLNDKSRAGFDAAIFETKERFPSPMQKLQSHFSHVRGGRLSWGSRRRHGAPRSWVGSVFFGSAKRPEFFPEIFLDRKSQQKSGVLSRRNRAREWALAKVNEFREVGKPVGGVGGKQRLGTLPDPQRCSPSCGNTLTADKLSETRP
jgi:hypothetical protein